MLAATPPMGWNSWNTIGHGVSEEVVRETAEAMKRFGMRELGYEYVVIDDCWSHKEGRDKNGNLIPDAERFPNGMKALADYVHGLGFKLGIYSDAAELTCAKWPGSYGHEEQDAALWASWGIDFLKYDYCHAPGDQTTAIERYSAMGEALRATGREILYSACEWGGRAPWTWARNAGCHMWRVTGDVVDRFDTTLDWGGLGILPALDRAAHLHEYAGPGGWNDMDMLVVGCRGMGHTGTGCTDTEYRLHMTMWVMLASPLMCGNDIRKMDTETAAILLNPEVLAVSQDPDGIQAEIVDKEGPLETWVKPLVDGGVAVALINRGHSDAEYGIHADDFIFEEEGPKLVRDLWARSDIGELVEAFPVEVPAHGTVMLKVGE